MSFTLNDGASIERVTEQRTTRDQKGTDVVSSAGDVILTGSGGEVATLPSSVFDAVFTEKEDDAAPDSVEPSTPDSTPDSSPSSEIPGQSPA